MVVRVRLHRHRVAHPLRVATPYHVLLTMYYSSLYCLLTAYLLLTTAHYSQFTTHTGTEFHIRFVTSGRYTPIPRALSEAFITFYGQRGSALVF